MPDFSLLPLVRSQSRKGGVWKDKQMKQQRPGRGAGRSFLTGAEPSVLEPERGAPLGALKPWILGNRILGKRMATSRLRPRTAPAAPIFRLGIK